MRSVRSVIGRGMRGCDLSRYWSSADGVETTAADAVVVAALVGYFVLGFGLEVDRVAKHKNESNH